MEELKNLAHVAEYIKDRLYFATVATYAIPCSTPTVHYFTIDYELEYESFYSDFGPLNLSKLYRYCCKLNEKLKSRALSKKKIVHYTTQHYKRRVNAAFLIASYAVIYLKKSPIEAYQPLVGNNGPSFIPFRDASFIQCTYNLTLSDCIHAVKKALENGYLNLDTFDVEEYEHYEKVENGDLNWIVPNKFLAFCGPNAKSKTETGYPPHAPEFYISYFRKNNVTTIIRLNKKIYDAQRFINHGFDHKDLYFVDGSTPSDKILQEFLDISENAKGAIAVHCKAGLGRTGTLIACYIMKHNHFTAAEAIGWIRICRPGSVIGNQQHWLEEKEGLLCFQGNVFRADKANSINNNVIPTGIVTLSRFVTLSRIATLSFTEEKTEDDMPHILAKVNQLHVDDRTHSNNISRSRREKAIIRSNFLYSNNNDNNNKECGEAMTQGDKLNRIKAMRRHPRSHTTSCVNLEHLKPKPRSSSQPFKTTVTAGSAIYHSTYISPLKPLRSNDSSAPSPRDTCLNSPAERRRSLRQHTVCSSPTKRCHKNALLNEKTPTR